MSMKRSKEVKRRATATEGEDFFSKKGTEKVWDWEKDVSVQADESFTTYAPKDRFAKGAFVLHTKFGKGVVIDVDASRVEVLFQDGPKKLAHGIA